MTGWKIIITPIKESYYKLRERDNRLSAEPEIVFNGLFTNWIEYLSIERIYHEIFIFF